MTQGELTQSVLPRYDGYMSASGAIFEHPDYQPSLENAVRPAPVEMNEAGKLLLRNQEAGTETDTAPEVAETHSTSDIAKKAEKDKAQPFTRDRLKEIAQTIGRTNSAGEVWANADFVYQAAKMLRRNLEKEAVRVETDAINKELLAKLEDSNIEDEARRLKQLIEGQRPSGSDARYEESDMRRASVLGEASKVAHLANLIADFYTKAKISREVDDPFRQIVSFEELMTQFTSTLDDDRFLPGGEFALIEVQEYKDEFGRILSKETAHPENFLRWVRERAWFYHDFDPMANIDLFQGMYLVAGTRKVGMYEILVDFDSYFSHRVDDFGDLKVLQEDIFRAEAAGNFVRDGDFDPRNLGGPFGKFKKVFDPDTGEETEAYVDNNPETDEGRRREVFPVYIKRRDADGKEIKVPIQALIARKEEWNRKPTEEYNEAKNEILHEIWLLMNNHNYDVEYRQKGMPSEEPLKEVLANINADNKFTRNRNRLLRIMRMPSTTHREEKLVEYSDRNEQKAYKTVDAPSEAQKRFKGELSRQGSTGKAVQRSLFAYYHIAEANGAFNEYAGLEELNPFFEAMRGPDVDGADIFYKRVMDRMLLNDKKLGYVHEGYDAEKAPGNADISVEFFHALNETGIQRGMMTYTDKQGRQTQVDMRGTSRKRRDWEKATFVDFMTLSQQDFLQEMQARHFTRDNFKEVYNKLQERYSKKDQNGNTIPANQERLQKLNKLWANLSQSSTQRRVDFAKSLVGKVEIKESDLLEGKRDEKGNKVGKDGIFYRFLNPKGSDQMKGIDFLAVGLFNKVYPSNSSEYTSDLNPYSNIRYQLDARDLMREAMRDALSFTEKLDAFDAKWAEEWAFTFTYHTGISARNDMGGIGHDAWSKIINTEYYRLRQTSGGNYPGNLDNLYGIHRLGTDFWQGLKVQTDGSNHYDKTLYEILSGLEEVPGSEDAHGNKSYRFNINRDIGGFDFAGNAQRQFFADHVGHVIDLFSDITKKHEFNFDKIVSEDSLGRVIINHVEMQKMIDTTWKHLRYGFDNNGFLYDHTLYGWWQDEKISADKGKEGQISRTPHFGLKKLRNLMFSDEVIHLNMYDRPDVSGWAPTPDNLNTKMARNVFAYFIKAQIEEHTKARGDATIYSADQIAYIAKEFSLWASRVMKGEHGEPIVLAGFFTSEEMYKILLAAHATLLKLYMQEYGADFGGGFLSFFFETMRIIMKEAGAGISLGK